MARGGYRPGAGRKKGTRPVKEEPRQTIPSDIRRAAKAAGSTPLEYMLLVMNNEHADTARRDRMAIAAAPFVHPRKESVGPGKREQAADDAKKAATGKFAPPAPPKLVVDNG